MLLWPGSFEQLSANFPIDHGLSFKAATEKQIEHYSYDGQEKKGECPRQSAYRILIFRYYDHHAGYYDNRVDDQ